MDVHILENMRLIVHVPIPATNNSAGVPWRTALTRSGMGGTTVLIDGDGTHGTISAAEKALVASGAVWEVEARSKWRGGQGAAAIDALVAGVIAEKQAAVQAALANFGVTR